jgi:hypothetical protein
MSEKDKINEEYHRILAEISGRVPKGYIRIIREKLKDESRFFSDFVIQNVKIGKTPNLRIARLLLEVADEYGPIKE